ncbi:TPA: hypothetical protein JBD21_12885 [Legionella pneumophila subsp. pneumophila]|uniref:Uncharacterized protein n=1 Tax=Legionella pneumophila subsp. pneumophila TaxID=91891 RepID=A0A3A6UGF6_LEGPN|nr:hypothetical protein A9P84_11870 [Legionella pneumophila]ERB41812.1 hypothetical protein N748_07005 [Legionella pneumophila str. 121004]ERH41016.1 hypothetical protein N750_17455 [Legionella pneumophila str. Leg01/53]ERH44274.1 hypothetical protein N751_14135 [Legionella pneumophila str. Leg01/11]ERI46673.1 hypothetical protein N749_17050 [Legionella pneumophila str. Leg01/20]RJY28083.1 hypothetical protein D1H99_02895 [Legionella pneumophila subsp. pneumophila]
MRSLFQFGEPTSYSLVSSYKKIAKWLFSYPLFISYLVFLSIELLSVMLNVRDENSNNKPGCF